ncbi:IS1/IS1595 family N-terminal zinc-binding domain-containing protein [Pseudofulvibacter geojedonensis]
MNCRLCKAKAVKNGKQKNGRQRYYCKICRKSFQGSYFYNVYGNNINKSIYKLLISGVGIKSFRIV